MGAHSVRKSTNMTVDQELIAEAKDHGINISRAAEVGIAQALAAEKARLWKIENREAFEYWNKHFEEHGLPLAKYRRF